MSGGDVVPAVETPGETVGAFEAKTHLSRLLEDVARGKIVTITKHGRPVAVLAPPDAVRPAAADEDDERGRHAISAWVRYRDARPVPASVAELLAWVKEGRR